MEITQGKLPEASKRLVPLQEDNCKFQAGIEKTSALDLWNTSENTI